ncbi:hypothetical protein LINPERHAP2_LOCUS30497 [Linum perenne]
MSLFLILTGRETKRRIT